MTAFETCDVNLPFGQLEKTLERIGSHSKKFKKSWKIGLGRLRKLSFLRDDHFPQISTVLWPRLL